MAEYERDGARIYQQSFATIRAEADLSRFPADISQVVVRMIHASGQVDLAKDIRYTQNAVANARAALESGAPILCDATMVASGITRKRLPRDNAVHCMLADPRVPVLAETIGNTRSAAAVELWVQHLENAVVAIGNAPTALFHLLDLIDAGVPKPAVILGGPVGFVGAVESKQALIERGDIDYLLVDGRRGGSAIAASAVNAVASEAE